MSGLRIHSNIRIRGGAYGGANAFMRTLVDALRARGHKFVEDSARADVVLFNALSDGLSFDHVRRVADAGVPIVHRRVGYVVSGSPEMRALTNGVPHGDRLQVAFDPYVRATIFQSDYSRRVFERAGFAGRFEIIHNGVDERIFSSKPSGIFAFLEPRRRPMESGTLRLIVSTWSIDPNKGFEDYRRIDEGLGAFPDVSITLVGRTPADFSPKRIKCVGPRRPSALARLLRAHDALLTLSRLETCSNALIEGLNCGLPAIYLDSGANREVAERYGVSWSGDFAVDIGKMREGYHSFAARLPDNPYRISIVAERYERLLEDVAR